MNFFSFCLKYIEKNISNQENIAHCYYKKFDDFDKYKNKFPPFTLSINNSYNIPNFINNNKMFEFNLKDNE